MSDRQALNIVSFCGMLAGILTGASISMWFRTHDNAWFLPIIAGCGCLLFNLWASIKIENRIEEEHRKATRAFWQDLTSYPDFRDGETKADQEPDAPGNYALIYRRGRANNDSTR